MSEQYGSLGGYAKRARKIDVWGFRSPFDDQTSRDAGYKAEISIFSRWTSLDGHTLSFRAKSKHFENPIEDTDIQRLHDKVKRAFEKQDMKARDVVWEEWIEVEIDEGSYMFKDEHGNGLTVGYKFLKHGVHPATGEEFTINKNGIVVAFPKPKLANKDDHKPDDDEWHHGTRDHSKQFSYIPATPANVAALESLCGRLVDLRSRLAGLLTQDTVQKSLSGDLARLLPPAK